MCDVQQRRPSSYPSGAQVRLMRRDVRPQRLREGQTAGASASAWVRVCVGRREMRDGRRKMQRWRNVKGEIGMRICNFLPNQNSFPKRKVMCRWGCGQPRCEMTGGRHAEWPGPHWSASSLHRGTALASRPVVRWAVHKNV